MITGFEHSSPLSQRHNRRHWAIYELALLALCAALVIWQLFIPPSLGVADNGDFAKLIGRVCLGGEHPLFEYVGFEYSQVRTYCWDSGLFTSAALPLRLALAAGKAIVGGGRFDMRWLGAVYALLFLTAFHALQRLVRGLRATARLLAPAAALLVFGGASYVPWFNSFYFDTASYIFLSLTALTVLRVALQENVKTWEYLAALTCTLLLASSKSQHAALALLLIPCFWLRFGRVNFPRLPLRIAATVAIAAAATVMFSTAPAWYQTVNSYNAFFYQSLPHSPDPAADLAQFGMDRAMVRYAGKHAFLPDSPMQNPRQIEIFGHQLSVRNLTIYYLSHPRIAALVFRNALDEGSLQRVRMKIGKREYRLGNYEKSVGKPPEAQSHFLDFWSDLKAAAFGNRPLLYATYAAGLLTALWILILRQPAKPRARLIAMAATWTAMVALAAAVVMFDGIDTGRHLFLFNAMLDMTVCALLCFA
ncbi:MAG: hypothetical protein ABSG25_03480 [Bryobacteraceae bacterium]